MMLGKSFKYSDFLLKAQVLSLQQWLTIVFFQVRITSLILKQYLPDTKKSE